jgi:hypothetical protein
MRMMVSPRRTLVVAEAVVLKGREFLGVIRQSVRP